MPLPWQETLHPEPRGGLPEPAEREAARHQSPLQSIGRWDLLVWVYLCQHNYFSEVLLWGKHMIRNGLFRDQVEHRL